MTATTRPFFAERKRIVELAVKYKFPAIYPEKGFVDAYVMFCSLDEA